MYLAGVTSYILQVEFQNPIGTLSLHSAIIPGIVNPSCYSEGLRAGRPGFDCRQGQEIFFLLYSVLTDSEAHPASHPIATRGYFPGNKAAGE
jgi:hypothetical protein